MGFAISLRSDHPSASAVRSLWNRISTFESRPSMASLDDPPHVTLAIYDGDTVGEAEARTALHRAARDLGLVTLTFDEIQTFEGPPMVLWAAPKPSTVLLGVHAAIHASINPLHCRPYYRPGAWTPHCTLGTAVKDDQRDAARSFASGFRDGFTVHFDALDLISFPPLAAVEMLELS